MTEEEKNHDQKKKVSCLQLKIVNRGFNIVSELFEAELN